MVFGNMRQRVSLSVEHPFACLSIGLRLFLGVFIEEAFVVAGMLMWDIDLCVGLGL